MSSPSRGPEICKTGCRNAPPDPQGRPCVGIQFYEANDKMSALCEYLWGCSSFVASKKTQGTESVFLLDPPPAGSKLSIFGSSWHGPFPGVTCRVRDDEAQAGGEADHPVYPEGGGKNYNDVGGERWSGAMSSPSRGPEICKTGCRNAPPDPQGRPCVGIQFYEANDKMSALCEYLWGCSSFVASKKTQGTESVFLLDPPPAGSKLSMFSRNRDNSCIPETRTTSIVFNPGDRVKTAAKTGTVLRRKAGSDVYYVCFDDGAKKTQASLQSSTGVGYLTGQKKCKDSISEKYGDKISKNELTLA